MNLEEYIQKLKAYVETQFSKFVCDDSESILEMLYDIYAESNSIDNEVIREDFHSLYRLMNRMPLKEMNKITDPVSILCREHEMAGFIHGVQVRIRIAQEAKITSQAQQDTDYHRSRDTIQERY